MPEGSAVPVSKDDNPIYCYPYAEQSRHKLTEKFQELCPCNPPDTTTWLLEEDTHGQTILVRAGTDYLKYKNVPRRYWKVEPKALKCRSLPVPYYDCEQNNNFTPMEHRVELTLLPWVPFDIVETVAQQMRHHSVVHLYLWVRIADKWMCLAGIYYMDYTERKYRAKRALKHNTNERRRAAAVDPKGTLSLWCEEVLDWEQEEPAKEDEYDLRGLLDI